MGDGAESLLCVEQHETMTAIILARAIFCAKAEAELAHKARLAYVNKIFHFNLASAAKELGDTTTETMMMMMIQI